ncbi:sugar ABC transporter permease [Streptacidiphilus sp. P02-A3a]|uniref:ABC transporter permease n=1 Tax=Streptacidiphilus sp. P02-A3a TaxID=2704468 RepID=UPI001CDCDBBC|nr:ABC transporter permease subunit [Streptacidiphilus sp. P02-A3a]QMU69816.1 sugar ABC transporter permease [Streptacidiphilus sp. P02-A3a]
MAATVTTEGTQSPARVPRRLIRRGRRARPDREPKLNWRIRLRRDKSLIIMTLPAVVLLLVFSYLPILGNITAFQYYDPLVGIWNSTWIGLQNFQQLFNDPLFWEAMNNTLAISAIQLVLFFPIPIMLALLLNSVLSQRLRSVIQSVALLPHFFSWVLVITLFQQMIGGAGLLNQFLRNHDIGVWNIMTDPTTFKLLVTSQVIWKDAGWGIIVFLAALSAIDQNLYEAAAVDGAGRWRRMWHITLPGIKGTIVLMLVLRLGNILNVGFEQLLIQRQAVGHDAADVLDTFSYYYGIATNNYGYGAAAGIFKSVISLVLVYGANKLAHLFGEDGLYRS